MVEKQRNKMKEKGMLKIVILMLITLISIEMVNAYEIGKVSESMGELIFETGDKCSVQVRFGDDANDLSQVAVGFIETNYHRVSLSGLEKGKIYYFLAEFFIDRRKIGGEKGHFTTKGTPKPEILGINVNNLKWDESKIIIHSSVPMELKVNAGGSKSINFKEIEKNKNASLAKSWGANLKCYESHFMIQGLLPLTEYNVGVISTDYNLKKNHKFTSMENNIALNKKVYGTFNSKYIGDKFELEGDVLKRVNDGIFSYKTGMAVSHPIEDSDQWVIIDLGDVVSLDKIITYWRALCYPENYKLHYSTQSITPELLKKKGWMNTIKWELINGNVDVETVPRVGVGNMPGKVVETKCKGVKAGVIRLFIAKGTSYYRKFDKYRFVQLIELKVYPKIK